jgi:DNA topoisomerase-1
LDNEEQLFTVTLDDALALFAQPKTRRGQRSAAPLRELGADPVSGQPILLKEGRFGPYVTDGETNASLRKGDTVEGLTPVRAIELLADRRAAGPPVKRSPKKAAAKKAAAKKASAGQAAAKKAPAKKTSAGQAAAKKAPAKKTAATKAVAKKTVAKNTVAKKAPARKAAATKTTAIKRAGPVKQAAAATKAASVRQHAVPEG